VKALACLCVAVLLAGWCIATYYHVELMRISTQLAAQEQQTAVCAIRAAQREWEIASAYARAR
jgi:hypothetical protein